MKMVLLLLFFLKITTTNFYRERGREQKKKKRVTSSFLFHLTAKVSYFHTSRPALLPDVYRVMDVVVIIPNSFAPFTDFRQIQLPREGAIRLSCQRFIDKLEFRRFHRKNAVYSPPKRNFHLKPPSLSRLDEISTFKRKKKKKELGPV